MSDSMPSEAFDPRYDLDISGLDPADVLAALYNAAHPVGLGVFEDRVRGGRAMERTEAAGILANAHLGHVDYAHGRPIKISFRATHLRGYRLYDRDHGEGAAKAVVDDLRSRKG